MSGPTVEVPKQKVSSGPVLVERGRTGLKESGGYIYEEFVTKLRWPYAGAVYQEMSNNDPVIAAVLFCCRMLIRQAAWRVEACSDSPADVECAEFVESCMNDMSMSWIDFIDSVMTYFSYGFSYHEIVYKRRLGGHPHGNTRGSSKYNDGRIGWRKIPGRRQTTLTEWKFGEDGGVRGVHQQAGGKYVFLPIEKCLLFRTSAVNGNPEGVSFLRGAYRPWYFKKHIEEIEGIGIERDLAGLPVIHAPEGLDLGNAEDPRAVQAKNDATRLVTSIRRDRNDGVVLGFGWDLQLLSTGGTRQFDTNAIINRYDQRIAITLLADIIMLGADKVGSFALAKVKQSMLATALDAQLTTICEVLNQYAIPRLIGLNSFPGITGYPRFVCDPVVAPDLTELGNFISKLAGSKMPLFPDLDTENYLRTLAKLPPVTEDAECRQSPPESSEPSTTPPNQQKVGASDTEGDDPSTTKKGGEEDAE